MRAVLRFGLIAVIVLGAAVAKADRIRVAVQKTGTLAWELDVIKRHGIERKLDLIIDTLELASTEAGKVALKGGSVDLILSDWVWGARERSLGDTLVFYPASTALGAVMTSAQSSIRSVLDLKARSSPSRAVRSTRAGFCSRRLRCAQASILESRPSSSTGRRRCCRRRRSRERQTRP